MSLLEELGASTAEKVGERSQLDNPRTMTDLMLEIGIVDPYCDGLSPVHFLRELAQKRDPSITNYAAEICLRCSQAPQCPINNATLDLEERLREEEAPVDQALVSGD